MKYVEANDGEELELANLVEMVGVLLKTVNSILQPYGMEQIKPKLKEYFHKKYVCTT